MKQQREGFIEMMGVEVKRSNTVVCLDGRGRRGQERKT